MVSPSFLLAAHHRISQSQSVHSDIKLIGVFALFDLLVARRFLRKAFCFSRLELSSFVSAVIFSIHTLACQSTQIESSVIEIHTLDMI